MPKPDKHVFICVQSRPAGHPRPSCGQNNCVEIAEEFYKLQQEKQAFDKIQVTTTGCLGPCSAGPSVLVYPDGVMYGQLKKEDVSRIFDEHLEKGQVVNELLVDSSLWG